MAGEVLRHDELDRRRGDSQRFQARRAGRDDVVALQELDLIAGERRSWQQLEQARLEVRQPERHIDQQPAPADHLQHVAHELREGIGLRPAKLVRPALAVVALQRGDHRLRDVADVDGLKPGRAAADQR